MERIFMYRKKSGKSVTALATAHDEPTRQASAFTTVKTREGSSATRE
jgi:hypothetical protein